MRYRSAALLLSLVLSAVGISHAQTAAVPRFESAPCALPVPQAEKHVDCGYLTVKENRTSASTRTIKLPVAIVRTESASKKPDPVLKTLGGPGASSLRMISGRRAFPWLKDRDFIIFEQRGTRYAEPALECPEVDQARGDAARRRLSRRSSKAAEVAAAARCYARLKASGIDLSAYNSRESSADIDDLRRVLDIRQLNIYGVSYSARLMLDVVLHHPEGIRSVVLESTLPPEVNYDEVGVDGIVRPLNVLFGACRRDAACNKAYPGLKSEFYAVVRRLNARPLIVSTPDPQTKQPVDLELSGDDFATWILDYLFSDQPASTADAPMVIHRSYTGDYPTQFKRYAGDKLGGGFYSWGMRYSVWCSEEMPFESMARIRAQSYKFPGLKGYEVMSLPGICAVWKVKPALSIENKPVTSSIPALVLGAEYDAYTDPAWGRAVSKRFTDSFFFEIPWAGHGPAFSVPCVSGMIAAFIDNPRARPDDACVGKTLHEFHFTIK